MTTKKKLIFHVDVNKTIILSDIVQGLDEKMSINKEMCQKLGFIDKFNKWKKVSMQDTTKSWNNKLVSYEDYIKGMGLKKEERNKMLYKFTEKGEPGECFRDLFDGCIKNYKEQTKHNGFEFLHWFLHLLGNFSDVKIVFRTYGHDITEVLKEWNSICDGEHPDFPNLKDKSKKIIMCGSMYRTKDMDYLGISSHSKTPNVDDLTLDEFKSMFGLKNIICESKNILTEINRIKGSIFIKDHYTYWDQQNRKASGGKPLYHDDSYHQFFFDDNIRECNSSDGKGIVNMTPTRYMRYLINVDVISTLRSAKAFANSVESHIRKIIK